MNIYLYKMLNINHLKTACFHPLYSFVLLVLSFVFSNSDIHAQSVINIKVTASVPDISETDIVVVSSLAIDETKAINGRLIIHPNKDAEAGVIQIKGSPLARFSVLFMDFMVLGNNINNESMRFKFIVSGFPQDNQQASQYLDPLFRELIFSNTGEYFLWIGGEMDMSGISPGNYEGIFAFEIEYL